MDYLFDRVQKIVSKDYVPSREDFLKCRVRTTGIVQHQYETRGQRFILFEFGQRRNERATCLHCCGEADAIIFVAALNHYGTVCVYDERRNAMHESIELFAEHCNSKWFSKCPMILLLTKDDLFRKMIRKGISLRNCFSEEKGWDKEPWTGLDYEPLDDGQKDDKMFNECYSAAIDFIQQAYMEVITSREIEVQSHVVTATDKTMYDAFELGAEHFIQRLNRTKD